MAEVSKQHHDKKHEVRVWRASSLVGELQDSHVRAGECLNAAKTYERPAAAVYGRGLGDDDG